jgi:glutamine synthetase
MAGSTTSVSCPSYMLNTITADTLMGFANILENAEDVEAEARKLIKETYINHQRIVFNGNNYSDEWVKEAKNRGLLNLKSAVDAFPLFTSEKNLNLFKTHSIFTEVEVTARQEILFEEYSKLVNIEALTMLDMVNKDILPAVSSYVKDLSDVVISKKYISENVPCEMEKSLITSLSATCDCLYSKTSALESLLLEVNNIEKTDVAARFFCDKILPAMNEIRAMADELETSTAAKYWPMPTYGSLLFT